MCHDCSAKNPKGKGKPTNSKGDANNGPVNTLTIPAKGPKTDQVAQEAEIIPEPSEQEPSNSGLVMIDTTKTVSQKRKEAAAARRNEKVQQKQAAKLAAAAGRAAAMRDLGAESGAASRHDASGASDSAALN